MSFVPSYIALHRSGELRRRVAELHAMLAACTICPHECRNNRLLGEIARCYAGARPIVSSYAAHFGEEPALVGTHGVGNIFFGNCNLRCVYCQNHLISQNWREERHHEVSVERLAEIMLELQDRRCHSVGLVSPTHFVPQAVAALDIAASRGLRLPVIYNTNAYDAVEVLRLLDGVIDIYLPDLKYSDDAMAYKYSKTKEYTRHARAALLEMHRQVGSTLVADQEGIVQRGLIIRHLVLPNDIAGSKESLRWIATALGRHTTLSVMSQYYPTHRALGIPLLDRKIRPGEYERVIATLDALGMDRGWLQDHDAPEYYRPDFEDRAQPFTGGADNSVDHHLQETHHVHLSGPGGEDRSDQRSPAAT